MGESPQSPDLNSIEHRWDAVEKTSGLALHHQNNISPDGNKRCDIAELSQNYDIMSAGLYHFGPVEAVKQIESPPPEG